MTVSQIQEELKQDYLSPEQLMRYQTSLAAEYSAISNKLARLDIRQAEFYKEHRAMFKSDAAVEREFSTTDEGKAQIYYRYHIKAIEKMLSAIKSRLNVLENQAKGIY